MDVCFMYLSAEDYMSMWVSMCINDLRKRAVNINVIQTRMCVLTFWEHWDICDWDVKSHYPFCIFKQAYNVMAHHNQDAMCVFLAYLFTSPYNTIPFHPLRAASKTWRRAKLKLTDPCFAPPINFPIRLKQQSLVRIHTRRD